MDQKDLSQAGFLEVLRQLVYYTDLPDDRKDYFMDLLTVEKFNEMSADDAGELTLALPKAQQTLEKMVLESNDPEKIYALAQIKSFTTELMDGAEEKALQDVEDAFGNGGGSMPSDISPKDKGEWLLNKLAGLEPGQSSEQTATE